MRPHRRKFLDDVIDTRTIASAAPAPREYYNNGNNNFSSLNETITRNLLGQSSSGIDSTSSTALKVTVLFTAFCFVGFLYFFIDCLSDNNPPNDSRRRGNQTLRDRISSSGIDPSTVQSLPLFAYDGNVMEPVDCPICLAEFQEKEMVKVIPLCRHVFHPQCIEMWLSAHASCPLCRSTQMILPLPLPLPPPPYKDPPSCFVAKECPCVGPSLLRSRTDIPSPTGIENEEQQQQRKVPLPLPIPITSSSSAVTRANSFSSSSRLGDRVCSLLRSSSF